MVKLKICGLTQPEDARLAADLGADFLGFIFHPGSPRCADPHRVRDMGTPGRAAPRKVGVFVDAPIAEVRRIFEASRLDVVQLHGRETPEYIRVLGLPAWKALRTRDESVLHETARFRDTVIVLDSYVAGQPGGTGRPCDPVLVRRAIETGAKIFVAGGVSKANVAATVSLRPFGVDVNSSLEKSPGRKCRKKMRRFFEVWRSIQEENARSGGPDPKRLFGTPAFPKNEQETG